LATRDPGSHDGKRRTLQAAFGGRQAAAKECCKSASEKPAKTAPIPLPPRPPDRRARGNSARPAHPARAGSGFWRDLAEAFSGRDPRFGIGKIHNKSAFNQ
jgi:hypothetical protein